MGKKIAIFSDGTGNSSAKAQKTNVWRAYKALDLSPGANQIAFYDNGVGTSSFRPLAALGGAFGFGLARNVRQIYGFVCQTYEPGDEIFGFGFSRGAFTMRVVAAFIAHQGIVDLKQADGERDLKRLIRAAYRLYRREAFASSGLAQILRPLRDGLIWLKDSILRNQAYDPRLNIEYSGNPEHSPKLIKFLAVWDTVDAYGLPIDEMTRAWDRVVWPLSAKDRNLSPRVQRACHALALDEQRQSFEPMLWNEADQAAVDNIEDERLTQIWFSGVHSDVGGGYPDDSLSLVPLRWLMGESAKHNGLRYLPEESLRLRQAASLNGPMHDSRRGMGTFYRHQPRDLEHLSDEQKPGLVNWVKSWFAKDGVNMNEVKVGRPKIHHTVFERLQTGGEAYAPINLPANYAMVQADGKILQTEGSCKQANGDTILADGFVLKPDGKIYTEQDKPMLCSGGHDYILPEDSRAAAQRRQRQELVWNKVWLRRLVYGLTVGAAILFLAFPFTVGMMPENSGLYGAIESLGNLMDRLLGTFNSAVRKLPEVVGDVPGLGFASGFFEQYTAYPYIFSILLLALGLLIIWGFSLKAAIEDEMRANWSHIAKSSNRPPAQAGPLRNMFAAIRNSRLYDIAGRQLPRHSGELLAIVLFVALILAIFSRLSFVVLDGAGLVCTATAQDKLSIPTDAGKTFTFPAYNPCYATGIQLEKDKRYVIEMEIGDGWRDGDNPGVKSDIYGWQDADGYLALFTPLRRHQLVEWYQPIARISDKMFDRYPLMADQAIPAAEQRGQRCLRHEFRARNTGELYVYLNDAVLFAPDLSPWFYRNNQGAARVRVRSLDGIGVTPAPLCTAAELGSDTVLKVKPD